MKHPIYPCLWFDGQAQEAAEFYCSVFEGARITDKTPMVVNFVVGDRKFMCLNGGPQFAFTEAVSFVVECDTQDEIDHYWERLTEGGEESMCGWLKDKFGVSWQIVPSNLGEMMSDPERSGRVVEAFMQMRKFDIAKLKEAYESV